MRYTHEHARIERSARYRARHAMRREQIARDEREWRDALKRRMIAYRGGKCSRCGLTPAAAEHIAVFEFHHRDPADKEFNVAGNYTRSWRVLQAELDKCDLVCANCHRVIEATSEPVPDRRRGRPPLDLARSGATVADVALRKMVERVQADARRAEAERVAAVRDQCELFGPAPARRVGRRVQCA